MSPFRFVKSTYTRWFRSKLGANAIERRPCSSPAVVTCREMSRNGRARSRPPCRTRITPRRSTTYRLPPCPVTYVGWSSPDITGCSRAAVGRGRRERRRSRQHTHQDPHPSRHGRHATPPWYGFCHGRHSHRVAGRVAGGRSRRGARAPRNRARVQGLASGGGPQDALQQPRSRGGRGPAAARRLRRLRAGGPEPRGAEGDRRDAPSARGRRDAARPEREAGRRVPNPRRRPARASGQLAPRAPIRDLGRVPPARGRGAHDVRPDDGGVVDLHRHPGDPPGHLPDVRRGR